MMADVTVIATAAISGSIGLLAAGLQALTSMHVSGNETRLQRWQRAQERREDRKQAYQSAVDLLTDWAWRADDQGYDVVREFTVPFVRAANQLRIYGSPKSLAAMDDIQSALAALNQATTDSERAEAHRFIRIGHDHLIMAAREDVGPDSDDDLPEVSFREGAGPSA